MTVIAYRDGVMASDSGAWAGTASHGWARKIARGSDGTLYGCAGNAAEAAKVLAWVDDGCKGDCPSPRAIDDGKGDASSFVILVAHPEGKIELITAYGREQYLGAPYMATGAEADVALGAMWAGASADQAVEAACEHGDRARLPVQTVCRSP